MVNQSIEGERGENRVNRVLGFLAARSGMEPDEVRKALGDQVSLLSTRPEQMLGRVSLNLGSRYKWYQKEGVEDLEQRFWLDYFSEKMEKPFSEYREKYPRMWDVLALNSSVTLRSQLKKINAQATDLVSTLARQSVMSGQIPLTRLLIFESEDERRKYIDEVRVGEMLYPRYSNRGLGQRTLRDVVNHTKGPSNLTTLESWTYAASTEWSFGKKRSEKNPSVLLISDCKERDLLGSKMFMPFSPLLPKEVKFYLTIDNLGDEISGLTRLDKLNKFGSIMTSEREVTIWGGLVLKGVVKIS